MLVDASRKVFIDAALLNEEVTPLYKVQLGPRYRSLATSSPNTYYATPVRHNERELSRQTLRRQTCVRARNSGVLYADCHFLQNGGKQTMG